MLKSKFDTPNRDGNDRFLSKQIYYFKFNKAIFYATSKTLFVFSALFGYVSTPRGRVAVPTRINPRFEKLALIFP